ncbi:MAG TPA: alpha/beta fold hydrolase [Patescibacteria group bacterium]|nr:alpha/beta fold hydrolase [Patescibacteria group bacterium]
MTRPITPGALIRRQVVLEEHDALPGGSGAVVVRRFVDGETYRSHLLLVPFAGRAAAAGRQLTAGAVRDTNPRVSPDGRRVAFLRSFPDEPDRGAAVMVQDLDGGEPVALWTPKHGASELAWSPDSRRMAFVAAQDDPRFIVGKETKGRVVTARRISRTDWRWDGVGHRDRWDQVWVGPVRAGVKPRQITHGEGDAKSIAWTPDGRSIAYVADPRPDAHLRPLPSIWVVPAAGGPPREAVRLAGYAGLPAFSPDGRWLACVGVDVAEPLDDEQPSLFVAPFDPAGAGPAPAVALAPDLDRPVGTWNDTDLNGWMASSRPGPWWEGAEAVVALVSDAGRVQPWRFAVDPTTGHPSGAPARLVAADIAAWTLCVEGGVVSMVATVDDRPMELLTVEGSGARARLRARTTRGGGWRRGIAWPGMRRLEVPGAGGPIETWIVSPAGAGDGPLPTVVNVHGGPLGAWSPAPSLENVLLATRGFRVILPNIRGSAAYGRAWITPQLGDWGGVDAADVLAAVDHVVELGLADPARLGILGLSYGGFMVNWLIGAVPDRFAAAVSENGVTNQVNDWANSDSGPDYCRMARLGDPLTDEGVAKLWRTSPLRFVSRIRTPLLLLQGESDLRCPAADNEQLFVALRHLGREVEYILYPESWHTFAVTGRPDRRIDRHERMLAWFERHLKG